MSNLQILKPYFNPIEISYISLSTQSATLELIDRLLISMGKDETPLVIF